MIRMLHIAHRKANGLFPKIFVEALEAIGELTIVEQGHALTDDEKVALLQQHDVALTGWGHTRVPDAIASSPGSLRYVCNITGTMSDFVSKEIVASDILVSNWGDTPAIAVAEGTMALLLAVLKDLHHQILTIREDRWDLGTDAFGGSLYGAHLGIYGCGAIGRRFVELVRNFGPEMAVFDPYCDPLPTGCSRAESLEELFRGSQIVVILAGLNDETRGSVTAELLALLPRDGAVINVARGALVNQDALFAELQSGRLRAGLDVLEPDMLPKEHPARTWRNCILSGHQIHRGWPTHGAPPDKLNDMHSVCLDNLRRFADGKTIRFEMDPTRYDIST